MIDTVSALHQLVSSVASGLTELTVLDAEIANLGERVGEMSDDALRDRYGKLELLLAEYTNGDLDRDELMVELRQFAPIDVTPTTDMGFVQISTSTSAFSRIVRRSVDVATDPSPGVDIRLEVVLA